MHNPEYDLISPNPGQKTRPSDIKQKMRTC